MGRCAGVPDKAGPSGTEARGSTLLLQSALHAGCTASAPLKKSICAVEQEVCRQRLTTEAMSRSGTEMSVGAHGQSDLRKPCLAQSIHTSATCVLILFLPQPRNHLLYHPCRAYAHLHLEVEIGPPTSHATDRSPTIVFGLCRAPLLPLLVHPIIPLHRDPHGLLAQDRVS